MIDVAALRALHVVASLGTVAKAADELGFTSSAVSQQIKRLERQLGVTVLVPAGRMLTLTPAGRILVDTAPEVFQALERCTEAAHSVSDGAPRGRLRVAAFSTAVRGLIAPAIASLNSRYPEIRVEIDEHDPGKALQNVEIGTSDVALVYDADGLPNHLPSSMTSKLVHTDFGDVVMRAGDIVPADGRLLTTATLETQEAALTGESAPVAKDSAVLGGADIPLGDRSNMVFQNTSVTRGTATVLVTETGMRTQMGRIASMLSAVPPSKSPLQRELDSLTKVLGIIAWTAVAVIVVIGVLRGQGVTTLLLLGISMGISAIPTGLPTFVQAMLAYGARQLADAKAVVKNLTDVETLGATSAINSDKTGTLTMNQMTVRSLYFHGRWYTVHGEGYTKTGRITHVAGEELPDFTLLAYGLCLDSDATVSDAGEVVGDPTEAALVVLAAKVGVTHR